MDNWRDRILQEFIPEISHLILYADPDGLLLEEGVLEGIRERGFEPAPFEDPMRFRYVYESGFRARWDRGEQARLVVILKTLPSYLDTLPYDLLQRGRRLSVSIAALFPGLSYPVIKALDRGDLDALYYSLKHRGPGRMGENETKDFVLRHVFGIAVDLIENPADLLRTLLRRHYRSPRIPPTIDRFLLTVLRRNASFNSWPLEEIVPERKAFFQFLQKHWRPFVSYFAAQRVASFVQERPKSEFPVLPFEHDDIRVYVDNLFTEGFLNPIEYHWGVDLSKEWVSVGIHYDPEVERMRRIDGLIETVLTTIPESGARHREWLQFAYRWAELSHLWFDGPSIDDPGIIQRFSEVRDKIDTAFLDWIRKRYPGLYNQPPIPPVMVHHIPGLLARHIDQSDRERVALLVVDGLALDQWIIPRDALSEQCPGIQFGEQAAFAWVPTITCISRQAVFAGKPPLFFPASIKRTDKEPALWEQFWMDRGLNPREVAYLKGLGEDDLTRVETCCSQPKLRVLGLVIDKVDKIMHGMELGTAGMHNQVRLWAARKFLGRLVDLLWEHGFRIFLTSDHGNLEARGCGRPAEGVVPDMRGERVRVYSDKILRAKAGQRFKESIPWPPHGLPEDFLALLAPNRSAFIREKSRIVGHGGISLEELVVPLIQLERRDF